MILFPFRTAPMAALLIMLLALLGPRNASAQASHTTHLPGLDVVMSLNKTDLTVGEPLFLQIQLINTSPAPAMEVRANFNLPPGNGVEVNIQPAGELEYRYLGALDVGTYFSVPMNVMSSRPETVNVMLLFDRSQPGGLVFPAPGSYTIDATFRINLQKSPNYSEATLPPTVITVRPAEGDDAKVLEILNQPEFIHAVHLGVAPTTGSMTAVSQAAAQYPKTPLGALALKAQGMQLIRDNTPESRAEGAAILKQYLENGVVHPDGDQVAWEIAAAYHRNKDYDTARVWVFWLARNFPQSVRIQASDALFYYYFFQPIAFTLTNPWYLLKESWVVPGEAPPEDLKPRQIEESPQQ